MDNVGRLLAVAAVFGVLGLSASAAPAAPKPLPAQKIALKAIAKAASSGTLDAATAAAARSEIARAARLVRTLPSGRREHVAVALGELANLSGRLTQPRALSVIGSLRANNDYFAKHYAPAPQTDVVDADGIVYRYFAGRCLEFHPLANFGALNARVAAGDADGASRLADALLARAVYQRGGGVAWEYQFPYGGGRAGWISGMAQAVAAQAFARVAQLVPENEAALRTAAAAYRLVPRRLLTSVDAGPWIKLYSFTSLVVLNAQLQAAISIQDYADIAQDAAAATLADRLRRSAAASLPRFDTGYWSYYALPGDWSPLDYQQYVVQLLKRLGPTDARFADAAARFAAYAKQPPAFKLANGPVGAVRFWLSKPATVSAVTAAGPSKRVSLSGGWHTLAWPTPKRAGIYSVRVAAVDWAGNRASFDALPIVRVAETAPKPPAKRATSAATDPTPVLEVGAAIADPAQAPSVQAAGLRLVRFGVAWPAGATAPDAGVVAALQRVPSRLGIVVDLAAAPADDAGRAQLAQYAASLVQQVPAIRDVFLTPAPSVSGVPTYALAVSAVRDAVAATGAVTAVGPAIDGSAAPKATAGALALALGDVEVVGFKPAPAPGKNLWTLANLGQLGDAFGDAPGIVVDGLVALPADAATAITSLACAPAVRAIVLESAIPDSRVNAAASLAQRGAQVCPGLAAVVGATTATFPASLDAGGTAAATVACTRDCLALVTLVRADGTPVLARRVALRAGQVSTVALPRTPLKPGAYALELRLAAQVNPGVVTRLVSAPLTVG